MKGIIFLAIAAAATNIGSFSSTDIDGNKVSLAKYLGFVTVVVNVASEWGLTERDYTQLQALYEKYQADGFRVVAFPSNQFGNQEPGSNAEIKHFAQSKFGVTFDMMAKTDVNGDNTEPVYQWMKNHKNGSGFLFDTIKWVCCCAFIINETFLEFYKIFNRSRWTGCQPLWTTNRTKLFRRRYCRTTFLGWKTKSSSNQACMSTFVNRLESDATEGYTVTEEANQLADEYLWSLWSKPLGKSKMDTNLSLTDTLLTTADLRVLINSNK